MRHLAHLILSMSLVVLAGCEKSSSSASSDKSAGSSSSDGKGAKDSASAKPTKIPSINLTVDLPPDASVSDGMSEKSSMISTDAAALTVSLAKPTDPKTSADGKASALATENLKIEKLADGWIVTSENTGSAGRNYWLTMRREIGGKGYLCETMQSNEAQVKAAIAICKGLKP
jgi:hypothetical protein